VSEEPPGGGRWQLRPRKEMVAETRKGDGGGGGNVRCGGERRRRREMWSNEETGTA
jgi:hypothetical protein